MCAKAATYTYWKQTWIFNAFVIFKESNFTKSKKVEYVEPKKELLKNK